jgi:2-keto-4-pentenoate hydratase
VGRTEIQEREQMIDESMMDQWAKDLHAAWESNLPKPNRNPAGLQIADAYRVQRQFLALRDDEIVGFKAGLTNASVQRRQGADQPAGGVLFASAAAEAGIVFSLGDFVQPRIETEIGFVIGTDIKQPVKPDELRSYLSHWLPMIELVDVGFSSSPVLTDLITSNVVASRFIRSALKNDVNSVNQATVCLYKNGELLHEGNATDTLGDQFSAAAWIVNHALAQGYSINAGHVLMTGALGTTHPPEAASYRADYGAFGAIEFGFEP